MAVINRLLVGGNGGGGTDLTETNQLLDNIISLFGVYTQGGNS